MNTTQPKTHANLLKKYHTLCTKLGMSKDEKDQILTAYGVGSSTRLSIEQLRELTAKLEAMHKPKQAEGDKWRKRLIAAIDGWLRNLNNEPNIDLIKSVACRAAGGGRRFNEIPLEQLRSLYYAFRNKSKDLQKVDLLTSEQMDIQAHLN